MVHEFQPHVGLTAVTCQGRTHFKSPVPLSLHLSRLHSLKNKHFLKNLPEGCERQKERRTLPGHLGCHRPLHVSQGRDVKKGECLPRCLAQLWMGWVPCLILKLRAGLLALSLAFRPHVPAQTSSEPFLSSGGHTETRSSSCPLTRSSSLAGPALTAGNKQMEAMRLHCPPFQQASSQGLGGGT